MRKKIREVFPDNDAEAWRWTGEDFAAHEIERPESDFRRWLSQRFEGSDEFTQRLVRRMFIVWQELENEGFVANDLELYEHQKALFAWIALSTATGTRERMANLLARSPYGSGKSLVAGLVVRAFKEAQEEMMAEGTDPKEIPTGALLGLRKEHMLQNALGQQYAVLQPPYTVERRDLRVYWKNLATMFGEDFTRHFPQPRGIQDPFFHLFALSEEDEELPSAAQRVQTYVGNIDASGAGTWNNVPQKRRREITATLEALIDGRIVLIPDAYNVPQPEAPLPREEDVTGGTGRYRGDSAHALSESEHYRVKTTHRHLAIDPKTYTRTPNPENPAQFCIAYGSMLTRDPESIRADVREEVLKRARMLVIDEAGAYTPGSLGDSVSMLSGAWPSMVGFTGQDLGVEGWTARSPQLSVQQMIRLRLMKPIGFQGIGDACNPPQQGSEEAWKAYRAEMFRDEQTVSALSLPQPHALDSVVIAPTRHVREYAHRIIEAHREEGVPVTVWCFDPAAGNSRWSIVVNGFNAPKKKGDPKRVLVAPPALMSEALHLHAECYDVLVHMNRHAIDQARGRLGHIRNMQGTKKKQEKTRTYFRMQWLHGARGEAYIRDVAAVMGYELPDENAAWIPLRSMIDRNAYERDGGRKNLSSPKPIPDSQAVLKRKRRKHERIAGTPLKPTSAYVIEREAKKRARRAAFSVFKRLPVSAAPPGAPGAAGSFQASKGSMEISILVGADGMPLNLDELSRNFSIGEYSPSLEDTVSRAHKMGTRSHALAKATLHEILRLVDVKRRRQSNGERHEE